MPLYMEMSQNINKTMRHLKFCYISILTNLLRLPILLITTMALLGHAGYGRPVGEFTHC